jgi:predicted transcriptional regulator
MTNVQITVDDDTLRRVDRAAKPLGLKRSEIVRQALCEWLTRRAVESFEQEWIDALRKHPETRPAIDDWLPAQRWGKS